MLKVNPIYAIVAAFALVSTITIVVLNNKVDSLNIELDSVKETAKNNAKVLDDFKAQYQSIEEMTYKNRVLVDQLKAENEKLRRRRTWWQVSQDWSKNKSTGPSIPLQKTSGSSQND